MGATISGSLTTNGSTDVHPVSANLEVASGFFLYLGGVFDGATITVQFKAEDDTYRSLALSSFTESVSKQIIVPNGFQVRLNVSGAGGSTDIYFQMTSMSYAR